LLYFLNDIAAYTQGIPVGIKARLPNPSTATSSQSVNKPYIFMNYFTVQFVFSASFTSQHYISWIPAYFIVQGYHRFQEPLNTTMAFKRSYLATSLSYFINNFHGAHVVNAGVKTHLT